MTSTSATIIKMNWSTISGIMRFHGIFSSSDINFTTFLIVNDKSNITTLFYIVYDSHDKYAKTDKKCALAIEVII